ncbi:hypothetical protein LCGC14_2227120 [marine sediment metagenome]|uniref:DNA (cytosine-5-)-methyltransferase n=1 Tax=marine sediment metagenome TaxID=412755 RepID=A0A0F9D9C7_9ZZZZ
MKFGSLFSGIGGLDLGLERAGMECAWQVEIDDYCQKVLTKHWPDVPKYKDVRDVGKELESVDLICGGFPCQPVSVSGQRRGSKDERWLWDDFYRIICDVGPSWVVVENVPGLYSAEDGRLFGGILRDLSNGGYDAEWDTIPAAAFGAAHVRERVFLVAHSAGEPFDVRSAKRKKAVHAGRDGSIRQVANAVGEGRQGVKRPILENGDIARRSWWAAEPSVGRVANGVPHRVDRLRGLGNAVVPQVAEFIGRQIMEANDIIQ